MKQMVFIVLCLGSMLSLSAQDFLGKSVPEIRQAMAKAGGKIQIDGDTLYAEHQMEDERGRIFDVQYTFMLKGGNCVIYQQRVAQHEYWITKILEWVETKEGKEIGTGFEVFDQPLYSRYDFEDFKMQVTLKDEEIWIDFCGKN